MSLNKFERRVYLQALHSSYRRRSRATGADVANGLGCWDVAGGSLT
jgi:hypothetical protein